MHQEKNDLKNLRNIKHVFKQLKTDIYLYI